MQTPIPNNTSRDTTFSFDFVLHVLDPFFFLLRFLRFLFRMKAVSRLLGVRLRVCSLESLS